jgi:glycosyltransferase involved in cell wall biosynthesis
MKPLRVILVMIEPPLPFGHATTRWSYALLKGLVQRGHRVTAFAAPSNPQAIDEVKALFLSPDYDLRCYAHPIRNRLQSKWETLRRPYSYMFSPTLRRELGAELEHGFDVLHLEETWAGWLAQSNYASKSVLNFHNLYAIDQPSPAPGGLGEIFRMALQRRAERRLLQICPMLMTVTPRLERAARAVAPITPVHVVPLGLDLALYPFVPSERRPSEPLISMIGSMDWYPSLSAAVRLVTRLWPAIKQRVSGARLRIVGRNARSALADCLGRCDLEIAENVVSTRPYFEATSVLLYAPVRGSGMKVKVLEAFAYGVPVVTTTDGVEGLPAQDGIHVGLCDDDSGLIERAVALLNDRAQQERQRMAARQLLEQHCDATVALDAVERCYTDILARNALAM